MLNKQIAERIIERMLDKEKQEISKFTEQVGKKYENFISILERFIRLGEYPEKESLPSNSRRVFIKKNFDNGKFYLNFKKRVPYLDANGRIQMARDEHIAVGQKLDIKTYFNTSDKDLVITCSSNQYVIPAESAIAIIESPIRGVSIGTAHIAFPDEEDKPRPQYREGVSKEHWREKSEKSAISRALLNMGYGITGVSTDLEEEEKISFIPPQSESKGEELKKEADDSMKKLQLQRDIRNLRNEKNISEVEFLKLAKATSSVKNPTVQQLQDLYEVIQKYEVIIEEGGEDLPSWVKD